MPRTSVVRHDGPKIRSLREAAGLNTVQFAKRIKCNPDYVSQFETGAKEHVSATMFGRICRVLGVNRSELIAKSEAA